MRRGADRSIADRSATARRDAVVSDEGRPGEGGRRGNSASSRSIAEQPGVVGRREDEDRRSRGTARQRSHSESADAEDRRRLSVFVRGDAERNPGSEHSADRNAGPPTDADPADRPAAVAADAERLVAADSAGPRRPATPAARFQSNRDLPSAIVALSLRERHAETHHRQYRTPACRDADGSRRRVASSRSIAVGFRTPRVCAHLSRSERATIPRRRRD